MAGTGLRSLEDEDEAERIGLLAGDVWVPLSTNRWVGASGAFRQLVYTRGPSYVKGGPATRCADVCELARSTASSNVRLFVSKGSHAGSDSAPGLEGGVFSDINPTCFTGHGHVQQVPVLNDGHALQHTMRSARMPCAHDILTLYNESWQYSMTHATVVATMPCTSGGHPEQYMYLPSRYVVL